MCQWLIFIPLLLSKNTNYLTYKAGKICMVIQPYACKGIRQKMSQVKTITWCRSSNLWYLLVAVNTGVISFLTVSGSLLGILGINIYFKGWKICDRCTFDRCVDKCLEKGVKNPNKVRMCKNNRTKKMASFAVFYIFSIFIHFYLVLICLIYDLPERDHITHCVLIRT